MKLAFLIAAHAHPGLLSRLIQRIQGPDSPVFVHIDAGQDIAPFEISLHECGIRDVRFVPRVHSQWGSFGQVRASLSLLKLALEHEPKADRFILISGQDYPLMKPGTMATFFAQSDGNDYLTCNPLPWGAWDGGGLDRLRRFHFALGRYSFSYPSEDVPPSLRVRAAYAACGLLLPRERALPTGVALYGGSNWWNLSRRSALAIFDFLHGNSSFVRRFRFTKSADEIFFQTALLNAAPAPTLVNDDLRYTLWDGARGELPATLRVDDFGAIAASGKLFARKMHPEFSLGLMNRIDKELLS